MRRRASPVQQWVDSIPSPMKTNLASTSQYQEPVIEKPKISASPTEPKDIPYAVGMNVPSMTVSAPVNVPSSLAISITGLPSSVPYNRLVRDPSLQSDSSHCSSVESLLELRKADPEAILLGLGFGGCSSSPQENGPLSRIPKRFLQPSKLKGIAINDFVKHQQETSESFDSVSLGYRGLTGSPYVAPSEIVQKIMDRLRDHDSHEIDPCTVYNYYDQYCPLQQNGTYSVLSPDNRQFLERPRSKSPDMRNKRMIIGQKSFAFGHDGDLIEIDNSDRKGSSTHTLVNDYNSMEDLLTVHRTINTEYLNSRGKLPAQIVDKKLSKQFSFDRGVDFSVTENGLTMQTCKAIIEYETNTEKVSSTKSIYSGADVDDGENTLSFEDDNITLKHSPDTRRASEGSCETTLPDSTPNLEGRRHSDSTVHTINNNASESMLPQKRKTLKRQSRISDGDVTDYSGPSLFVSNAGGHRSSRDSLNDELNRCAYNVVYQSGRLEPIQIIDENAQLISGSEHCGANFSGTITEASHDCVQATETEVDGTCRHGDDCADSSCGPQNDSTRYWHKMEKIMQENKKLKNIVAKNRREMAEIREVLSNVLSVRMEPGF